MGERAGDIAARMNEIVCGGKMCGLRGVVGVPATAEGFLFAMAGVFEARGEGSP